MVLENAVPDQFHDDTSETYVPPTDPSSPFARFYPLRIKPELITRPGRFSVYLSFGSKSRWERKLREALAQRIESSQVAIQRYPTQEELDAFVTHASRGVYEKGLGIPLGFAAGAFHASSHMRKAIAVPTGTPPWDALQHGLKRLLRGDPSAVNGGAIGISVVRLVGWTFFGYALSSLAGSYHEAVGALNDPRLHQWREDLRHQRPGDIRRRKIEQVSEKFREQQRARQQSIGEQHRGEDLYEESQIFPQTAESSYYGSDSALEGLVSPGQDNSLPHSRTRYPDDAQDPEFFNDVSPTIPSASTDGSDTSTSSTTSRSAWERVRQQNAPSPRSGPWRSVWAKGSDDSETSLPGSSSANERDRQQFDREHAQRAFERMLDAERRASQDASTAIEGEGR